MGHCVSVVLSCLSLVCGAGIARGQCEPELLSFATPINGIKVISEYQGQLVVGGSNASINHLARWDGSQWLPFGSGPGRIVSDVITFNGDLYAAGSFADRVARWNGSGWQAVGSGFIGASVLKMAIYHDELIIAGKFTNVGGETCNNIARWDGSA